MTSVDAQTRSNNVSGVSRRQALWGIAGATSVFTCTSWLAWHRQPDETKVEVATTTPVKPADASQPSLTACLTAVDDFHLRDREALQACLAPVDTFFHCIHANVEPLVDDLFSLSSSFWLVKYLVEDQIYGTSTAEDYVAGKIETWLELPKGLERALGHSRETFCQRMVANEQQLYVRLEPELKLLVPSLSLAEYRRLVGIELESALKKTGLRAGKVGVASNITSNGLDVMVGYLFGEMIKRAVQTAVTRVVASLVTRGGTGAVETVVISGGTAGSPWTGGISLLVGVLVAVLIDWIVGKISAGYAIADLKSAIDDLHHEVRSNLWSNTLKIIEEIHAGRCRMVARALQR